MRAVGVAAAALDVEEDLGLDAAGLHARVERPEQVGAVVEAVAGDQDRFGRVGEELADDDGGVARGGLLRFGAGPHEVDARARALAAIGEQDLEKGLDGAGVEAGEGGGDCVGVTVEAWPGGLLRR